MFQNQFLNNILPVVNSEIATDNRLSIATSYNIFIGCGLLSFTFSSFTGFFFFAGPDRESSVSFLFPPFTGDF